MDGIVAEADDRQRADRGRTESETAFRLNFLSLRPQRRAAAFRISTSPFLDKERIKEEGEKEGREVNLDFGGGY